MTLVGLGFVVVPVDDTLGFMVPVTSTRTKYKNHNIHR